jgi:hypothetical protein
MFYEEKMTHLFEKHQNEIQQHTQKHLEEARAKAEEEDEKKILTPTSTTNNSTPPNIEEEVESKLFQLINELEEQNNILLVVTQKNQLKQIENTKIGLEKQFLQSKSSTKVTSTCNEVGTLKAETRENSQQMVLLSIEEMTNYKKLEHDLKQQQQHLQRIPNEISNIMDSSIDNELKTARQMTIKDHQHLLECQANDSLTLNGHQETLQKESQDLCKNAKEQEQHQQIQDQEEKISIQHDQLEGSTKEDLEAAITASASSDN